MDATEAYNISLAGDLFVNGKQLFFTKKYISNNDYRSVILRIDMSKEPEQVTFEEKERKPKMYGNSLYFIRYEKENETLMKMDNGKEPVAIATFAKIRDYSVSGSDIFIIAEELSDNSEPFACNRLKYRFNGRGLIRSHTGLYLFNNNLKKIYSGDFDVLGICENGNRIIIETSEYGYDYSLSDLFEINKEGKKLKRLTKEPANINGFAVSSAGKVAFSGSYGLFPWKFSNIIFPEEDKEISIGSGAYNTVISDAFMPAHYSIKFLNNDLYAIGQEKSSSFIYKIGNSIEKITDPERSIADFDIGTEIAYSYTTQEYPSIVHFGKDYNINPEIKGKKADVIDMDGGECFALINSKNAPTIVFIHGGPHDAYGHAYFTEFQYFFSNGYNIIFTNPPGSTGYGQEYEKECVGDWGGKPLDYIKKFISKAIEKYKLSGKLGVTGGSYGGYMVNWIVTKTDMFSCAISERSISNLLSMVGTSDIGFWFNTLELDLEDPYSENGMKKLLENSPITYIKNVKTPTMLITGEEDYRCPIEQAEQFFVALKMQDVDTELIRYMEDNHEHARAGVPKNMVHRLGAKKEWFDRFLMQ